MAGKIRQRVIDFFRDHPQQWWTSAEVVQQINCGSASIFLELHRMGVLYRRTRTGSRQYEYQLKELIDRSAFQPEMGVPDAEALLAKLGGDVDLVLRNLQDRIIQYQRHNAILSDQITDLKDLDQAVKSLDDMKGRLEKELRKNVWLQDQRDRQLEDTLKTLKAALPEYLSNK